jgi:hypothetical protein
MSAPLTSPAQTFFLPHDEGPRSLTREQIERTEQAVATGDRHTCRWCLEKFDVEKQEHSTPERGYLRTNLRMADDGRELVCCDACWQGAIGAKVLIHGRVVPGDPNVVDNPLLRASVARG